MKSQHELSPSLLEVLQAEFSPPLDSSLVAAIIADYVSDDHTSAPNDQLDLLREVLSHLATQAEKELVDEDILSEQLSNVHISSYSVTDDTVSSHDFSPDTSNTTSASSSTSDSSSQHSFSSPLGFLQAAFPHVPTAKLRRALSSADNAEAVDMESVVEGLLSSEYVRELEERGLDGLDDEDLDEPEWLTVNGKRRKTSPPPPISTKKSKKRGTTFTIVDIRQKQHERPSPTSPRVAPPDPWTQLSSVALYLSTLLPTYPASYFQSALHSPEHASPAKALRAVLGATTSSPSSDLELELRSQHTVMLFSMFDVIRASPEFSELNAEERDQILDDAQLALRATQGQPDRAIDIVWLLRNLDKDATSREFGWGVYHSPAPVRLPPAPNVSKSVWGRLPTGPPAVAPPPRGRQPSSVSRLQKRNTTPAPNAWKTIPLRQSSGPHPLAVSIPAYRRKVRGGGNGLGKGGKGDVGELGAGGHVRTHMQHARELMEESWEARRQAARAWQRGNARTHGGEVAFYYAERARELQQQAREEQLDVAREMVQAKRTYSTYGDTVDLHGTIVAEAVQIAKDVLRESGSSQAKPLKFITGRGKHSMNGVGVLGPAVKKALEEDGWIVRPYEGGLVVRGKNAWRS